LLQAVGKILSSKVREAFRSRPAFRYSSAMRRFAFFLGLVVSCGSARTPPLPMDAGATPDAGTASEDGGSVGADGGLDGGVACAPPASDPLLSERQRCTFSAGALAADTVGLSAAARAALPIRHVIVVMKENRSFDHLFGGLSTSRPDVELFPSTYSNKDLDGGVVTPFHLDTTCVADDPAHGWNAMHAQVNDGGMDGYVASAARSTGTDGHFALGYYERADLPFYYFLANTFALADHYFPSVRGPTFPNRDYLLLGTSDGVRETQLTTFPDPSLPTIFDRLDAAGVSWGVYADDHPLEETLNNPSHDWEALNLWRPVNDLIAELTEGSLPSVVFVDGLEDVDDEHPTADVQRGEAWTKRIYDALVSGPAWSQSVLLLTYDEGGGFFDHLPPPNSCVARPQDAAFFELGTRVPLIAVSPWARRGYVSKSVKEHTSITRFIEAVFDLQALTARDANSDALLDMFDFSCPPPPVPRAPDTGTGGCPR
jgi:phospholipase C